MCMYVLYTITIDPKQEESFIIMWVLVWSLMSHPLGTQEKIYVHALEVMVEVH
jgi:hypothetical protein